jgi:hypothetical protein
MEKWIIRAASLHDPRDISQTQEGEEMNVLVKILGSFALGAILSVGLALIVMLGAGAVESLGLHKFNEVSGMLVFVVMINLIYYGWLPLSIPVMYFTFREKK